MLAYVARRLLLAVPLVLVATVVVFVGVRSSVDPSTALQSNPRVSPADVARYRQDLGLDRSGPQQYLTWLGHFVTGRWGTSLVTQKPVAPQIGEALANSLRLGVTAVLFSLLIGIAVGVKSSLRPQAAFDTVSSIASFVGVSVPTFLSGLLLQLLFGVYLVRWLDLSEPIFFTAGMSRPGSSGFDPLDRLRHIALPALVLSFQLIAVYSRFVRVSMIEALRADHVRTARGFGLPERRVLAGATRNALVPLTTRVALDVGALTGGLIITEQIFEWPGMGRLFLDAMHSGDYAIVLPWVVVTFSAVVLVNLLADIAYAVLDPRVRLADRAA